MVIANRYGYTRVLLLLLFSCCFTTLKLFAQDTPSIDVSDFHSSSGQWHHNTGDKFVIRPLPDQEEHKPTQVKDIADNILLYQQRNGGWLKNYDMLAVLTDNQKQLVKDSMGELAKQTTFDNH